MDLYEKLAKTIEVVESLHKSQRLIYLRQEILIKELQERMDALEVDQQNRETSDMERMERE